MVSTSQFKLPPGLSPYNLARLSVTLVPAAAVLAVARVLDVNVPTALIVLSAIMSIPVTYAARIVYRDFSVRRRAAHAGAVLPPEWVGKKFGHVDILAHGIEQWHKGYIGDGFWDKVGELGGLHNLTTLWEPMYFTTDADVLKTVLATNFYHYEKGEAFRDMMHSVLGDGVFNSDGELWKSHRTMIRPYFTRDKLAHFEGFNRHATIAIEKMKERFRSGAPIDFQDIAQRFTLDSATEFLFGSCVGSLETDLPYPFNVAPTSRDASVVTAADRFADAFRDAQHVIATRARMSWAWKFLELHRDLSAKHMQVVDAYLQPILEEKIKKHQGGGSKKVEEDEEVLLDHLVKQTDDKSVLRDETLNILIAGRDSTAATLTFAVYMLCMYPDVLKRLRAEIVETVGSYRMPTFEDIRTMKYLRAVLNETLRLYSVIPFNFRIASRDTTIPNPDRTKPPVFVPAGVGIAFSAFLMHRRKDYWGPDALEFDPDRFLDERVKYITNNPFIFLPFNAGPRICPGQQFAYNEASFFLIRLLQNFSSMELDLSAQPPDARPPPEWRTAEGQKGREEIVPKAHILLYIHGGLWVKMTEVVGEDAI